MHKENDVVKNSELYKLMITLLENIITEFPELKSNFHEFESREYIPRVYPILDSDKLNLVVADEPIIVRVFHFKSEEIMISLSEKEYYKKAIEYIKNNFPKTENNFTMSEFFNVYFNTKQSFEFDRELFATLYKSFEQCLEGTVVESKALTLIPNLSIESDELIINENVKLVKLDIKNLETIVSNTHERGLLLDYVLDRFTTSSILIQTISSKANIRKVPFTTEIRSDFLKILWLFKSGDVSIVNSVIVPGNPFLFTFTIGTKSKIPSENIKTQYLIKKTDEKYFIKYYNKYQHMKKNFSSYFRNALFRFQETNYRKRDEDKLIDLIIAYESIFLNNNPELSFRLAYSVSHLIGKNAIEKREIFDTMKNAYNCRSKIVHGSGKRKLSEAIRELPQELVKLKEYFRRSFKEILEKDCTSLSKTEFLQKIEDINLGLKRELTN